MNYTVSFLYIIVELDKGGFIIYNKEKSKGEKFMYYINPIWFYFIGLCDDIIEIATIISTLCMIGAFVGYLLRLAGFEEETNKIPVKLMAIIGIISLAVSLIVPSSTTVKEMMIASVVTHENVDATIEDVKELIDYTIEKAGELNENN